MATTGYIFASPVEASTFDHVNNVHSFYGPNDSWWSMVEEAGDDFWLYENDGATPGSQGGTGGWSQAANSAGGGHEVTTRSTGRPTLYYDKTNGVLHVLELHGTTDYYSKLTYNPGSNDWTINVASESVGVNVDFRSGLVVDTNGIPWICYLNSSNAIKLRYRDTDNTWKDGPDIKATGAGSTATQRPSPGFRWSDGGTDSIGFVISNDKTPDELTFAYRADADAKSTAWTTETASDGSYSIDDHVSVAVGKFSGDSTHTIVVVAKGVSNYQAYRRAPNGTWGSINTDISSSATRVKAAMDEANEEVYAFYTDSTKVVYQKSAANTTLSFGAAVTVLEDDGVNTFSNDIGAPQADGYTSASGIMVFGSISSTDETWWNKVEIAGGGWSIANIDLDNDVFDGQTGAVIAITGTVAASGKKVWFEQSGNWVEQTVTAEDTGTATITVDYGGVLVAGAATVHLWNPL